jgi:hypothetical protein
MLQHHSGAVRRAHEAHGKVDGGGLPCPIRPEETEYFARFNRQRKIIQRGDSRSHESAILLGDMIELENGSHAEGLSAIGIGS